ncbi:hypothetical protein SBA4_3440012 [Candidatus Sulfopaludibacter sp. SbA4]|nr:hypothetical protein SBA4_3440012 [Candidatus Sulfopaludibacter sp. SbA4]
MRLIWTFLYFGSLLCGQRVIYDAGLDKKGQDAAAAAKLIVSDSVTANENANLAVIERQQLDTALEASLNTMRLQIHSFDRWKNVYDALGDVSEAIKTLRQITPLSEELTKRKNEIEASAEELKKAVRGKQKEPGKSGLSVTAGLLDKAVGHISDVNDLLGLAQGIPGLNNLAGSKAVNEIEGGLKELDDLLKSATAAIQAAKAVSVNPRSLMPSQDELMLSVLAAETDSLKERIAIRARFQLETGDIMKLVAGTKDLLQRIDDCVQPCTPHKLSSSDRLVSDSLAEGDTRRKENLLGVLYQAAAVAAQNQTPADVAAIRETIAWRRFEIRRNAIYNGSYEQALQVAGQRLSAYYATGIKPSQIAQFLYYLSGIVSLPAIAF